MRIKKDKMNQNEEKREDITMKYEALTLEVNELEGELGDYNLAFDKERQGISGEDILYKKERIEFQNNKLRQ